jgi:hypothetical protein
MFLQVVIFTSPFHFKLIVVLSFIILIHNFLNSIIRSWLAALKHMYRRFSQFLLTNDKRLTVVTTESIRIHCPQPFFHWTVFDLCVYGSVSELTIKIIQNIHIMITYSYVCKRQFNLPVFVFTENVVNLCDSQIALIIKGLWCIIHYHMWVLHILCNYMCVHVRVVLRLRRMTSQ